MNAALTIESFWRDYCAQHIARGASEAQLHDAQMAFYSGAVAMYDMMMTVTDPDLDPDEARSILAGLYDERDDFLRAVEIALIDR